MSALTAPVHTAGLYGHGQRNPVRHATRNLDYIVPTIEPRSTSTTAVHTVGCSNLVQILHTCLDQVEYGHMYMYMYANGAGRLARLVMYRCPVCKLTLWGSHGLHTRPDRLAAGGDIPTCLPAYLPVMYMYTYTYTGAFGDRSDQFP